MRPWLIELVERARRAAEEPVWVSSIQAQNDAEEIICFGGAIRREVIALLIERVEELEQTALNGAECSACLKTATEPICMYCSDCTAKLFERIEELEAIVDQAMRFRNVSRGFRADDPRIGLDDCSGKEIQQYEAELLLKLFGMLDAAEAAREVSDGE